MKHTCIRAVVAGLIFMVLGSIGHAAVLQVPGGYPRIQTAIDTSTSGDVILVSPGLYSENLSSILKTLH